MAEKKRIFVLLFSVILYFVPQGMFLYYPEEIDFGIGIPWYLFRFGAEVDTERFGNIYTYSNTEVIGWHMLHMRVLAYVCFVLTLVLLVEHIYQVVKKMQLKDAMHRTVKWLVTVTTIQYVCSLIYFLDWFVLQIPWKWMQGITLIQMVIARALRATLYGETQIRKTRLDIWKAALQIWLCCYALFGHAFAQIQNVFRDDEPIQFLEYSVFGIEEMEWKRSIAFIEYWDVRQIGLLIVGGSLIVFAIVMMFVKETIRTGFLNKIGTGLDWVMVGFMVWIAGVCLFAPQMREATWYFKPDILVAVLICMGCWSLAGASGKRYHKKHVELPEV